MARPPRLDVPDAFYHVIARGNQRRSVFRDDTDSRRTMEKQAPRHPQKPPRNLLVGSGLDNLLFPSPTAMLY